MTLDTVAQANSKTAEFARLFDLFDRIATRRTRVPNDATQIISADDIANVPAEFAPVLKNISTILSLRSLRDEEYARRAKAAATISPRSRDDSVSPPRTVSTNKRLLCVGPGRPLERMDDEAEGLAFPFNEHYPFTFKFMLHELYELDEWVEKVKLAVEASRTQFKPLVECDLNASNQSATSTAKEMRGRLDKRNSIRSVFGGSAKFNLPSRTRARSETMPFIEANRVLKKRCIGRRKSFSGPASAIRRGVWVYDAAISATEAVDPSPGMEITLAPSRDARILFSKRVRHRSLGTWEELQRHRIRFTLIPGTEEVPEPITSRSSISLANPIHVTEAENRPKQRKRSATKAFAASGAAERPACV